MSACLFLKETSKCWSLKISVFQGNTAASFQSINSSTPSCSADKQFHPACSLKWKLERGICGLVLKSWCPQKKRAAFVSQCLMQSHAGVRGTPCRNKSLLKQMSLLMVLSALHVDKEIFQCKRESCGLPSLSQKKYPFPFFTIIMAVHVGDNFVTTICCLVHKQYLSLERNGLLVEFKNKRSFH